MICNSFIVSDQLQIFCSNVYCNGTATNVTGTVAVAHGGTGATTAAAARTNLGITCTSLYNGSLSSGSITFNYGNYNAYLILGQPGSATAIAGIVVPKGMITTSDVKYQMIRLGYGSADGNSCGLDGYFEKNVANALKAGIDIGCYFYSYATSVAAAKKEAAYVVSVLQKYKGVFTYPVAFDLEDKTQQGLGKTVLTDMVIAFGDAIEKAGFYCSLYSNLNWLKNYLDDSKLKRFDHWLAQWASAPTYTGVFGMWQSSSTGKVSGINGNVDTDIAYKDYPTIIKNAKLNGFTGSGQTPTVPTQPEPLPSVSFKKGDLVKITGTKYYGGQTIPAWVKAKNWYVLQVNGSRVVIDKSEDGKNAICSPVNAADLKLVNAKPTKTVDELAREVIRGLWGNGTDRKNRLTAAGYDYYAVQARVNEILK